MVSITERTIEHLVESVIGSLGGRPVIGSDGAAAVREGIGAVLADSVLVVYTPEDIDDLLLSAGWDPYVLPLSLRLELLEKAAHNSVMVHAFEELMLDIIANDERLK